MSLLNLFILIICWYILFRLLGLKEVLVKLLPTYAQSENKRRESLLLYLSLPSTEQKKITLSEYKFFSKIVGELIRCRAQYGSEVSKAFMELKKSIRLDSKESKKIQASFKGGLFQYLTVCLFAWLFMVSGGIMLNFSLSFEQIVLCLVIQISGLIVYFFGYRRRREILFKPFSAYFESFYTLRAYTRVSLPLSFAIERSRIHDLCEDKNLAMIKKRAYQFIETLKTHGVYKSEDFDHMIEELWDNFDLTLESFNRFLIGLKFLSIAFFALLSFLLIVYFVILSTGVEI